MIIVFLDTEGNQFAEVELGDKEWASLEAEALRLADNVEDGIIAILMRAVGLPEA
jgi:hypothetical protein